MVPSNLIGSTVEPMLQTQNEVTGVQLAKELPGNYIIKIHLSILLALCTRAIPEEEQI